MKDIAQFSRNLKKDFTPKIKNSKKPVSSWPEKDILNGKIVEAFVIIFRTRGCSWAIKSGCSMCGYFNDSQWEKINDEDLLSQFDFAMNKYNNQKFVKIFTSGSFLDDAEIMPSVRKKILETLANTTKKISVESRPQYITEKKLINIKKIIGKIKFEIGVGLETADDSIRKNCINKGFTFNDYKKAVKILKKHKIELKTYLLIKPPFLTEKEAIEDAIKTVNKIKDLTDTISFNPTNIQKNTVVNYLWKRKQYRSPWLWSIIEILKNCPKNVRIKCDISGGGSLRGAHNCKECDSKILKAIENYSLKNDLKIFQKLNCKCKEKWLDLLDLEELGFGTLTNM